MSIAIMGSGGVGGYFGARLALAGYDAGFIARGAHLAALREHELVVESQLGNLSLPKVRATDGRRPQPGICRGAAGLLRRPPTGDGLLDVP